MVVDFRHLEVDEVGAAEEEKEGVGVAGGSIHLIATSDVEDTPTHEGEKHPQDVNMEAAGDEDYPNLGKICQTFHRDTAVDLEPQQTLYPLKTLEPIRLYQIYSPHLDLCFDLSSLYHL
jgi:hypothetical protein